MWSETTVTTEPQTLEGIICWLHICSLWAVQETLRGTREFAGSEGRHPGGTEGRGWCEPLCRVQMGADHRTWLCVQEVRRGRRGCVGHSARCRGRCGEKALSQRAERCPVFTLSPSRGPAWFLPFVWHILRWPFSELSLCFNCFAIILFPSSVVPFSSQVNLSACPSEGHNF